MIQTRPTADAPPSSVGAVIVHGFTSDHRAVEPLGRIVQSLGMPTEIPLLRGHGGGYRDLRGCRWEDWAADVAAARARLQQRVAHTILIGFSMGGLLALQSAAEQPEGIVGLVALAPALRIAHRLAPIAWMARGWMPYVPMGKTVAYSDPLLARGDDSYAQLAGDAFWSRGGGLPPPPLGGGGWGGGVAAPPPPASNVCCRRLTCRCC